MAPPSLSRAKSLHRTPANRETIIPFTAISLSRTKNLRRTPANRETIVPFTAFSLSLANTYAKIPRKAARLCGGFLVLLVALRLTSPISATDTVQSRRENHIEINRLHRSSANGKTHGSSGAPTPTNHLNRLSRRYVFISQPLCYAFYLHFVNAPTFTPLPCLLLREKGDRVAVDEECALFPTNLPSAISPLALHPVGVGAPTTHNAITSAYLPSAISTSASHPPSPAGEGGPRSGG